MIKHQEFTHIGRHSVLEGTLFFNGKTQIEGHIKGEIRLDQDYLLILGIDSFIEGKILCHDIEIYGKVEASIEARGRVVIYPSAIINGQIKGHTLEVLPGAEVNIQGHTLSNL